MAQQKQQKAKAFKKKGAVAIAASQHGKNSHKTSSQYLRGQKNGGPTLKERVQKQIYAELAAQQETDRNAHRRRWGW